MESLADEGMVEEIRSQWKQMWRERIDDRVRAEGVACESYEKLFVERGTVVVATRDFKVLSLKDILELHKVANAERLVPPNPNVGGWGKFVRTHVSSGKRVSVRVREFEVDEKKPQQLRKGGRGWLHV
jgi:ABC-type sulfate transport system substrate-binding protein